MSWNTDPPLGGRIVLEALAVDDAVRVARSAGADEAVIARVVETAEGNPLFVKQLAALGDAVGDAELPASIAEDRNSGSR